MTRLVMPAALAIALAHVEAAQAAPPLPLSATIPEVQGGGETSPLEGEIVEVTGIVTGLKHNGFFLQAPEPGDGDPATSDGVFVFGWPTPPTQLHVGYLVEVTGEVNEFVPAADPGSPPVTEIGGNPAIAIWSGDNALPAPVPLSPEDEGPYQFERYEGMRVKADSLVVIGPTLGFVDQTTGTVTTTGTFFGVTDTWDRPMREPGIVVSDPLPIGAPCCVPRWDGNPERIGVDSDGQVGAGSVEVATGQAVSNVIGPLDYAFRNYVILPDPASLQVGPSIPSGPAPRPAEVDELAIGTLFLDRLYDADDDPTTGEPVPTSAVVEARLSKLSLAIRTLMSAPDVIAVQDVEGLAVLEALADRINADTVSEGGEDPQYVGILHEGNDLRGLDVGLLVKTAVVTVVDVTQVAGDDVLLDPTGVIHPTFPQPPLVLRIEHANVVPRALPLTVIAVQLLPATGSGQPGPEGAWIRVQRRAQAEALADLVQARMSADPEEQIVVIGSFGGTQMNDGYVDVVGTILGTPTDATEVILASADRVTPNLLQMAYSLPASERYTEVTTGTSVLMDHALVTASTGCRLSGFDIARLGADSPTTWRTDADRPEQATSHDGAIAYIHDTGTCPHCGDGALDPGEQCDGGADNSDTLPDACRTDCTPPTCGDGVIDATETCDDGAANSDTLPDACRADCTPPACGDGVIDAGEDCDDNGDSCSASCTSEIPGESDEPDGGCGCSTGPRSDRGGPPSVALALLLAIGLRAASLSRGRTVRAR